MTINNFLQLQPSVRPVKAQVTSEYFIVERAAKICIECHLVPLQAFPPRSPRTSSTGKSFSGRTILRGNILSVNGDLCSIRNNLLRSNRVFDTAMHTLSRVSKQR